MSEQGQPQQSGASSPASPPQTPGFPENAFPIIFEGFAGLNTKPLRPAIEDQEMYWCDGWFPIGKSNLRTLYGIGSALYTATGTNTIVCFAFGNFSDVANAYILLSNGSVQQVNVLTKVVTQVMAPGTIQSPASQNFGVSQWASKYISFVNQQDNGYWLWDGTNLFTAGTLGPIVNITNSGLKYTTAPTFALTTTGAGTGATFSGTVLDGSLTQVLVTNPGTGFAVGDLSILTITGGGSDNTAKAHVTINTASGGISGAFTTAPGKGYATADYVTFTGGGASREATIVPNVGPGGAIEGLTVVDPGVGYTSAPTLAMHTSGGSGWTGFATISTGQIATIVLDDAGTGYKIPPTVTIIGDGTGATAQASINVSGQVTAITVLNGGQNYTKALVQISGGNNAADATISLMPFGVSGTTIETYQSHVWIGSNSLNIPKVIFSATDDPGDFNPSDGGGAFPATDAFLRVAYHRLVQSNGFLYLIADSSMNYVSGVQTDSTGKTTLSNLNVDPQIGTPWPSSVQVFSRNVVFANSFGIHVSYGGAVQKISQPLDGVYNTVITATPPLDASSAVASIFGIQVYMLLLPIIDPYTGQKVNKLLIWDGKKWFTSDQEVQLTYIATQEINSVLNAWGTDGTSLYPLFQTPSIGFQKVVQSKLWANPGYLFKKAVTHLAGIVNFYNTSGDLTIILDNESGGHSTIAAVEAGGAVWTNQSGVVVTWVNASAQIVTWPVAGLSLIGPQYASQNGTLMGMTITTTAADLAIVSMLQLQQLYETKV